MISLNDDPTARVILQGLSAHSLCPRNSEDEQEPSTCHDDTWSKTKVWACQGGNVVVKKTRDQYQIKCEGNFKANALMPCGIM